MRSFYTMRSFIVLHDKISQRKTFILSQNSQAGPRGFDPHRPLQSLKIYGTGYARAAPSYFSGQRSLLWKKKTRFAFYFLCEYSDARGRFQTSFFINLHDELVGPFFAF